MTSLFSYTLSNLRNLFANNELPKFAADQVYDWIYRKKNLNIDTWTNVSKKVKTFLLDNLSINIPEIVWETKSKDGTKKYLIKMSDGNTIETVLIPAKDRITQCLSSQVGCAMGCKFCRTATEGFTRNLTTDEIIGQYLKVSSTLPEDERISNIVYMGQGEPLHNFENVKNSIIIFMEEKGIAISQRKITVSTSGLVPQIKKLNEFPPVNLSISLHSAFDSIRSELMPINQRYDIEELFNAIKTVNLKAYRRITYEYLLIDGINNSIKDIEELCKLLNRKESKINLIPFNEFPNSQYKRPSDENIIWFMEELNKRGLTCTLRASKGKDILAACGQLKSSLTSPL